jgi:hypothetical protein
MLASVSRPGEIHIRPEAPVILAVTVCALAVTTTLAQKVFARLSDATCSPGEHLVRQSDVVTVVASCESDGSMRAMRIGVTNIAPESRGKVRAVTVGFCYVDAVISAESPVGWVSRSWFNRS